MSALARTPAGDPEPAHPEAERSRARRDGVDRRAMAVLSAAHMVTDLGQGSIPALLPFLIDRDGIDLTSASALILAATISSSVIQPLFGHFSDRRSLPWLMAIGPVLSGIGVALIGLMPSYWLIFAAVLLSGTGVAGFHPEGSRFAHHVSGDRRSSGMSLFSVGGNVGFALGPALMTPAVLLLGLHGTLWVLVPATLMGIVVAHELPRLTAFREPAREQHAATQASAWGPFALLAVVISLRSFVYFGLVTFLPLYFIRVLHTGPGLGGAALTAMLLGGAAGTLIGGPLADRYGRRRVLICSMLILPPLIVGLLVSGPALAIVFGALVGAATIATFAITIVMGQEFLPARIGVASGVTIGLSIGLGGVGAPLLGLLAQADGLRSVFELLIAFPLLALGVCPWLPSRRRA
ncbi:MAG: MFS transporter [Solirubrobacteraceae bacterium]